MSDLVPLSDLDVGDLLESERTASWSSMGTTNARWGENAARPALSDLPPREISELLAFAPPERQSRLASASAAISATRSSQLMP